VILRLLLFFLFAAVSAPKKPCLVYYPILADESELKTGKYPILTEEQKLKYECVVSEGKLVNGKNNTNDIGRGLFVITKDGRMFFNRGSIYSYNEVGHISFTNKEDVIFAGAISTDSKGNIIRVTTESGHYKPDPYAIKQVLDILSKKGVDPNKVSVGFGSPLTAIDLVLLKGSDFMDLNPKDKGKDIFKVLQSMLQKSQDKSFQEKVAVDYVMAVYLEKSSPKRWIKPLHKELLKSHFDRLPDSPMTDELVVTAKGVLLTDPRNQRAKKIVEVATGNISLSHLRDYLESE
jgi:hypothetical protein